MKKNMINSVHIEGVLYSHTLEARVSGENSKNPGTKYIAGDLDIATDENGLNVVTVHYSYVTPTYAQSHVSLNGDCPPDSTETQLCPPSAPISLSPTGIKYNVTVENNLKSFPSFTLVLTAST